MKIIIIHEYTESTTATIHNITNEYAANTNIFESITLHFAAQETVKCY